VDRSAWRKTAGRWTFRLGARSITKHKWTGARGRHHNGGAGSRSSKERENFS
jgi:hypothetical protein